MSEKSYELVCRMFVAVSGRAKDELEPILGEKLIGYGSGNFIDFERHKQRVSTATNYNSVNENDEIHRVMMEVELLLEASAKRTWSSIMLTHDEFPSHGLVLIGLWRAALHGFTRLITAHNYSDSWRYDGGMMAESSC